MLRNAIGWGLHLLMNSFSKPPTSHGRKLAWHAQNNQLAHPQDLDLHNGRLPVSTSPDQQYQAIVDDYAIEHGSAQMHDATGALPGMTPRSWRLHVDTS